MLERSPPWPPDYLSVIEWRMQQLVMFQKEPWRVACAKLHYSKEPIEFIKDWCDTYDPRKAGSGIPTTVPFILFRRQEELVAFLHECITKQQNGLIEKCRDIGATWVSGAFSVWAWLFKDGASVGWGSRKEQLVDKLGDPDSIFEKMRIIIRNLPPEFMPAGFNEGQHMAYMRIINPENGSTITGEAGDNIGRGGRKLIYFKDESAWYEHPESIEAALTDNTNCQIDISSVSGLGTVFERKRAAGIEWEISQGVTKGKINVFVFDWRDHPAKDQAWYDARRASAEENGLLHLFAQEVERNYAATIEGTVVPAEWIESAINAHTLLADKISGWHDGGYAASLDVADGGNDRNALAICRGVVLEHVEEWGERDTGATARRAIAGVAKYAPLNIQYDCIGVGSGVKAEANRLKDEKVMPKGINLIPWDAGSSPLRPDKRVVEGDRDSPLNKDFYQNLKAQGWWELRRRFEKTHNVVMAHKAGSTLPNYKVQELISIDSSKVKRINALKKEISQVVRKAPSGRMRLVIDKLAEGMQSPNMGDAVMQLYWPASGSYDYSNKWVR